MTNVLKIDWCCNKCGSDNSNDDKNCHYCKRPRDMVDVKPQAVAERNESANKHKRPIQVTIISWILIIFSITNSIGFYMGMNNPKVIEIMRQSPIPREVHYILGFLGVVVLLSTGITMLNRMNFGRWLYSSWTGVMIIVNIFTSPSKVLIIPGLIIYIVIVTLIFTPASNRYFHNKP